MNEDGDHTSFRVSTVGVIMLLEQTYAVRIAINEGMGDGIIAIATPTDRSPVDEVIERRGGSIMDALDNLESELLAWPEAPAGDGPLEWLDGSG